MSFDPLARHYRWMECVLAGKKLQHCRTLFLNRVNGAQHVLIVGEGNGRFLIECRRKLPAARTTIVDASARMLRAARERLAQRGLDPERVEFVHADALAWKPEEQAFDLIVTHFFLDCFPPEELKQVIANLARAAAPGAAWLLADFQMPADGLRRCRARVIHAMMYAFFRFVTRLPARRLTPPDGFLKELNFVLLERRTIEWGLLHTDLWMRDGGYPLSLAAETSARSRSCNVMSPRIFPLGSSSNTTINAVDSISRD